jgi:hypothetical protein
MTIQFPFTVKSIEWDEDTGPVSPDRIFGAKAGAWVAVRPVVAEAHHHLMELPNVLEVSHRSVLDKPVDAVVSPANSFGFMDGGVVGHTCSSSAPSCKPASR